MTTSKLPEPPKLQEQSGLRYPRLSIAGHLFVFATLSAICLGVVYLAFGITIVEKALSALALPVGLIWLALLIWVYISISLRQRSAVVIAGFCLAAIWGFGNSFVANQLAKSLEHPYFGFELAAIGKLDAVIVLGGGTTTNLNGQAQLSSYGDRVAMAAKVFFAGKTDRLICSGMQTYRSSPEDLHVGEETRAVLLSWGIPEQSLETIGGANTSQEMQALKTWMADHPERKRIGILTSAWHLHRAMRLANNAGIEATPIPANFISSFSNVSPDWVIPSSENLNRSTLILHEYLARLVNR